MIIKEYLSTLPQELVEVIIDEYQRNHANFHLNKWDASQLNGGRFGEAVLRIIEFKDTGSYTPIGNQLNRRQIVTRATQNPSLPDSYRLKIPALSELVMDFRNNRNVAHLGTIDPNEMDAAFVIQASSWILAELILLESSVDREEINQIIGKLSKHPVSLIEEIGGRLVVLDPRLTSRQQIITLCYHRYPKTFEEKELFDLVGEKNISRFRVTLKRLDGEKLIVYHKGTVVLTSLGVIWAEKNINFKVEIS